MEKKSPSPKGKGDETPQDNQLDKHHCSLVEHVKFIEHGEFIV